MNRTEKPNTSKNIIMKRNKPRREIYKKGVTMPKEWFESMKNSIDVLKQAIIINRHTNNFN